MSWVGLQKVEMFSHNQIKHFSGNTSHQMSSMVMEEWWFGSFFAAMGPVKPSSHWDDQKLLCIPKYSAVKHEAICLIVKTWTKLGHSTGQSTSQFYKTISKEGRNQCCNSPVKIQSSEQFEMPCQNLKWTEQTRQHNWSNFVKNNGPKFIFNNVKHFPYDKQLLQVIAG